MSTTPARTYRPWYAERTPWLVALILIGLAYYGLYVRHSFNFRDEGGTEVLYAQRLLNGERPFLDVVLGYNVMWFYPMVGLFKLFGVNFVLLRGYCFFLSLTAAVCGFLAMEKATRRPWLAFLVALMLVAVPGMTFKNYMPFLSVLNSGCLLAFALASGKPRDRYAELDGSEEEDDHSNPWEWLLLGAPLLGLTYLIRIDLGLFFSVLWIGVCLFRALAPKATPGQRIAMALAPLFIAAVVVAVHYPVYRDAQQRGFARNFLVQYTGWPQMMVASLKERLHKKPAAGALPAPAAQTATDVAAAAPAAAEANPNAESAAAPVATPEQKKASTAILKRKGLEDMLTAEKAKEQMLAVLLYLPLISLSILAVAAAWQMIRAWREGEPVRFRRALAALVVVGGALAVFPQYFFFRPDGPHLSEFSPAFWVAVVSATALLASLPGEPRKGTRWWLVLFVVFLVAHAGLFLVRMLPDRWVGTIWAMKGRTYLFEAENGVSVFVSRKEMEALPQIHRLIRAYSAPDEYLVAYPYHPSFNVLANRRTYEKNIYIDNATAEPRWNEEAIARIKRFRPAVIILSDWAVNGNDDSRFSVWAAPTQKYIQENYTHQGRFMEFDVYTREKEERFPQHPVPPLPPAKK